MSDSTGGPYVQVAAFCMMAVEDKAGTTSLIRIVDRYTITAPTEKMQPAQIQTTLVIALKAGFLRQTAKIKLEPRTPKGNTLPSLEFSALFEGDDRGVQFIMPMNLVLDEEGLYWFELSVDGMLLTRIPLRLVFQKVATGSPPAPGSQAS